MRPAELLRRGSAGVRTGFDALVPAACVGCGRAVPAAGSPLCGLCRHRLPRPPAPRCARCGAPTVAARSRRASASACAACAWWPETLAAADAPFAYRGIAAATVRALKYGRWRSVARTMVEEMAPTGRALVARLGNPGGCVVVPVPSTAARLRERGFNQARILADGVASALERPVLDALDRSPGGGRQAAGGVAQRRENVAGRFRYAGGGAPGRPVLIVDDVLTTGSTVAACARALAEAGFTRIGALTFARTAPNSTGFQTRDR